MKTLKYLLLALLVIVAVDELIGVARAVLPIFWASATGYQSRGVTFSQLSTTYSSTSQSGVPQTDGTFGYCSDCSVGANNVCVAGGTGSAFERVNGVFICGLINAGILGSVPDPLSLNKLVAIGASPSIADYDLNGVVDPVAHGAFMDLREGTDGAMSASSAVLAGSGFTSNDCKTGAGCTGPVNKGIVVMGAGNFPQWPGNGLAVTSPSAFTFADDWGDIWWAEVTTSGTTGSSAPLPFATFTDAATTVAVTSSGQPWYTYTTTTPGRFTGIAAGNLCFISGDSTNAGNNGLKRIIAASATLLVVAETNEVAEAAATSTFSFSCMPGPGQTVTDGTAKETVIGRQTAWMPGMALTANQQILVRISGVDYVMQITTPGTGSTTIPPTWSVTCPAGTDTCTDGGATWTNEGPAAVAGLSTTIASYQSANQVTLATAALNNVSNVSYFMGTPDDTALNASIVAASQGNNGKIRLPLGGMFLNSGVNLSQAATGGTGNCVGLEGMGAEGLITGGSGSKTGSILFWGGAAGGLPLQTKNCPGITLKNFRVTGVAGLSPYALLNVRGTSGCSSLIHLTDLTLGYTQTNDTGWILTNDIWPGFLGTADGLVGLLTDSTSSCAGYLEADNVHISSVKIGWMGPPIGAASLGLTGTMTHSRIDGAMERGIYFGGALKLNNVEFNDEWVNIEQTAGSILDCSFCNGEGSVKLLNAGSSTMSYFHGGWFDYEFALDKTPVNLSGIIADSRGFSAIMGFDHFWRLGRGTTVADAGTPTFIQGSATGGVQASMVFRDTTGVTAPMLVDLTATKFPHTVIFCPAEASTAGTYANFCGSNVFSSPMTDFAWFDAIKMRAGMWQGQQLATPGAPTLTGAGTTGGATTWAYKIVANNGTHTTAAGAAGQTTVGQATLDATNLITVKWNPVPGADSYTVYRTTAGGTPNTVGIIGAVGAEVLFGNSVLQLVDTGQAGDTTTPPTTNGTGTIQIGLPVSTPSAMATPAIGCPTGLAFHGWFTMYDSAGAAAYVPTCQ